ncbi:hypothetical protein BKA93DRAFT_544629 [Sparassis latifolia]
MGYCDIGHLSSCGNVGKLTRICGVVSDPFFTSSYLRKNPDTPRPFNFCKRPWSHYWPGKRRSRALLLIYHSDVNHSLFTFRVVQPTVARLFELSELVVSDLALLKEAQVLQAAVSRADFLDTKTGIAGTKGLWTTCTAKYGGLSRRRLSLMAMVLSEISSNLNRR